MRLPRWKRKHGVALCGLVILLPAIAFGISNLFLLSPKGRAFIAGKIAQRLPFETSVAGATWSPWNGFTIYGIRIDQPAALRDAIKRPLLTVQSVTIHPDWKSLPRKRLVPKGVDVVKPEVHFAIELLSRIPHEEQPILTAQPPDLAVATPSPVPEATASQAPANPPAPAAISSPEVFPAPPPAPVILTPNVWINIRGGRLVIDSLMAPSPLFEAAGIDGSVPISGKKAKSMIRVSHITGLGQQAPGKVELPLEWAAPLLGTEIIGGEMFGFDFKCGGYIALMKGIPFRIDAAVPEQKDREIRIGGNLLANLGHVASRGRMQGYLQSPVSWQGQWIAKMSAVDVEMAGRRNRFDYGQALLHFQKGALRCLDARLCSEEATVIGNGMLLSDGRMAAITRIVAAPETLVSISKLTQPATATTQLTPLNTPQRAALDLQVFGRPGNLLFKPNPGAVPILLR